MPYLDKSYLDNLSLTSLLSTPSGKYNYQRLTTDQSANTNRARLEHILLSVITVGSKDIAIGRACLGDKIINSNQSNAFIDIWGHGDRYISPTPAGSGVKMWIVGSGRNSDDGIPPRNIGTINLFDGGTSYLDYRSAPWHGAAKCESENLVGNSIFKTSERENNFEFEKFGRKNSVILNTSCQISKINKLVYIKNTSEAQDTFKVGFYGHHTSRIFQFLPKDTNFSRYLLIVYDYSKFP